MKTLIRIAMFIGFLTVLVAACKTDGNPELNKNYSDNPTTQAEIDENLLIDYIKENSLEVTRTESGLYYVINTEGNGPNYKMGQPCKAHYTGYTLDGKVFDSSHKRNQPLGFNIGGMIPGWNEGLQLMNAGTSAKLLIPSHLAYGERGFPGLIEPNSPLIFDIELLPL